MSFVSVGDIQIHYKISGQGPRLLYISGTGADLRNKPNIFDSPLADQFEILAFDQRGLGQTDRPDIPYTMEDYANDAAELLKAVGWQYCHVMGVSFGGMVAQELALRHGDCIDHLVLCCTSSGGAGGHSYPYHELPDLPEDEMDSLSVALNDSRHDIEWQKENRMRYERMVAQSKTQNAGVGEPGREMGARRQIEARIDHNTFERLPQLVHPVFIAGGAYDPVAPPANLEAIKQQVDGAMLELFQGGHDFYNTDPRAYQRIATFLLGNFDN